MSAARPQRLPGLAVERVDGELMVLDERRQHLHCLAPLAATVFEACDGTRTSAELAARLADLPAHQRRPVTEAVLQELAQKGLVTEAPPPASNTVTRRKVLLALGIAVPFIATVLAPTPAQAASCVDGGKRCKDHKDCCSGVCLPGGGCMP